MALVVHQPFVDENGVSRVRGDVLFGADADLVARHPHFSALCSAADDSAFAVPALAKAESDPGPNVLKPVAASDVAGEKK
jgi:hypothetical protein